MARDVSAGLMPGARMSKEDVNYRSHEKCGTGGGNDALTGPGGNGAAGEAGTAWTTQ